MAKVYVASSWRNDIQPAVVTDLLNDGHKVYDFRNPPESTGFGWAEVGMPSYIAATNSDVPADEYLAGLTHPRAVEGFAADFKAMRWADTFVLVLPCGRSAHLELGWAVGRKRTAILVEPEVTPELMYMMVDRIFTVRSSLREWVSDECPNTLRQACITVLNSAKGSLSSGEILQGIRDRWGNVYPYASVLDVADQMKAYFG